MNRNVGIALLVVGVVLLIMGFNASESLSSELSEAFGGAPSNKAIWLMVGGAVCAVVGGLSVFRGRA